MEASIASESIRLERGMTMEECIRRSDERMYEVKRLRKPRERDRE